MPSAVSGRLGPFERADLGRDLGEIGGDLGGGRLGGDTGPRAGARLEASEPSRKRPAAVQVRCVHRKCAVCTTTSVRLCTASASACVCTAKVPPLSRTHVPQACVLQVRVVPPPGTPPRQEVSRKCLGGV